MKVNLDSGNPSVKPKGSDSSLDAYSELLTTSKAVLEMPSGNFSRFNGEQYCGAIRPALVSYKAMRLKHRKISDDTKCRLSALHRKKYADTP